MHFLAWKSFTEANKKKVYRQKNDFKMGYMTVEEHSSTLLHLSRSPGMRSWSLLIGVTSVGVAAAYYSSDSVLWKLFYLTGCLFVAIQNMEEWQEAVLDKSKNQIQLKTISLYASVLTLWKKGQERVVLDLSQVCDVCVHEERVRYLGTGFFVMLRSAAGFSYPITQSATLGGRSDVEAVAALLKRFLGLEELQRRRQQQQQEEEEEDDSLLHSTDSDDEADSSVPV